MKTSGRNWGILRVGNRCAATVSFLDYFKVEVARGSPGSGPSVTGRGHRRTILRKSGEAP